MTNEPHAPSNPPATAQEAAEAYLEANFGWLVTSEGRFSGDGGRLDPWGRKKANLAAAMHAYAQQQAAEAREAVLKEVSELADELETYADENIRIGKESKHKNVKEVAGHRASVSRNAADRIRAIVKGEA